MIREAQRDEKEKAKISDEDLLTSERLAYLIGPDNEKCLFTEDCELFHCRDGRWERGRAKLLRHDKVNRIRFVMRHENLLTAISSFVVDDSCSLEYSGAN